MVAYYGIVESNNGRCKVDWVNWETSIDFVANQSTKLKLETDSEHGKRANELSGVADEIFKAKPSISTWTDEDWRDGRNIILTSANSYSTYFEL